MSSKNISPGRALAMLLLQQGVFACLGAVLFVTGDLVTPAQLAVTTRSVFWGLLLAAGLIALVLAAGRWMPRFTQDLNETVIRLWRKMGVNLTPVAVVLLALGAGVGEEFLFRGALQSWLAPLASPWGAIAIISVLFGALHAASTAYFFAATVIGLVLGVAYYLSDSLVTVVVAHVVYDIWAINRLAHFLGQRA